MFGPVTEEAAESTLHAAWDAGIRYFDTAPLYGTALSEHRFGKAMRAYPRDQFVLSTKVGRLLRPNPASEGNFGPFVGGLPFDVVHDYGADAALRAVDDSLQRLGMAQHGRPRHARRSHVAAEVGLENPAEPDGAASCATMNSASTSLTP
jgi:D-threo-aldose 1-dehydrogenase